MIILLFGLLLLLLLLSENLSHYHKEVSNVLRHALCQYVTNRKFLSERLKESKERVSSLRYTGRLFHADGPAQKNALLPAVFSP